jgi:hypothetical protein
MRRRRHGKDRKDPRRRGELRLHQKRLSLQSVHLQELQLLIGDGSGFAKRKAASETGRPFSC